MPKFLFTEQRSYGSPVKEDIPSKSFCGSTASNHIPTNEPRDKRKNMKVVGLYSPSNSNKNSWVKSSQLEATARIEKKEINNSIC